MHGELDIDPLDNHEIIDDNDVTSQVHLPVYSSAYIVRILDLGHAWRHVRRTGQGQLTEPDQISRTKADDDIEMIV